MWSRARCRIVPEIKTGRGRPKAFTTVLQTIRKSTPAGLAQTSLQLVQRPATAHSLLICLSALAPSNEFFPGANWGIASIINYISGN